MLPVFKNGEHMKKVWSSYKKVLDKIAFLDYNIKVAGVAQSVVQLIRNQQVVCSSHITSSKKHLLKSECLFVFYTNLRCRMIRNLPYGQCCIRSCVRVTSPAPKKARFGGKNGMVVIRLCRFFRLSHFFAGTKVSCYVLDIWGFACYNRKKSKDVPIFFFMRSGSDRRIL